MPAKKENMRLTNKDILELISKRTTLTMSQAKEFVDAYKQLLNSIIESSYIEDGFELSVLDIFTIELKEFKNIKKGDSFQIADLQCVGITRNEKGQYCYPDNWVKGTKIPRKTMIAEYDYPNHLKFKIKVRDCYKEKLKQSSMYKEVKSDPKRYLQYVKEHQYKLNFTEEDIKNGK